MNEHNQNMLRRQSSHHLIIKTKFDHFLIICTLATRNDSIIITIDPSTGNLLFVGINGVDIFINEDEALDHIKQTHLISEIM